MDLNKSRSVAMNNNKHFLFIVILLFSFLFSACSSLEYVPHQLSKIKLTVAMDESAQFIVNTGHEVVLRDDAGVVFQITHLDRMQYDDAGIGRQVIATAQEQGFSPSELKVERLDANNISGVYLAGKKGDSLVVVGGFIGRESLDGYLSVFHFPEGVSEVVENVMRSITYNGE